MAEPADKYMQIEQERADLYWALRTRILSDAEMIKVRQWDWALVTTCGEAYNRDEAKRTFNEALCHQFLMQQSQGANSAK